MKSLRNGEKKAVVVKLEAPCYVSIEGRTYAEVVSMDDIVYYSFGGKLYEVLDERVVQDSVEINRVEYADVIARIMGEKPYYEIKYKSIKDGEVHVGYGSYDSNNVFAWLKRNFVVADKDAVVKVVRRVK